jgi:RHS repeat-associated protein
VSYANGRTLLLQYNNRLFLTRWDLPNPAGGSNSANALGYAYSYNQYGEGNTGRPDFADSLYDSTLDRAWTNDHVGRLKLAYSGREANAIWGSPDGPYAQGYNYDVWGNITSRYGWGGWNASDSASYVNNRRVGMQYDAAGNLLSDNYSTFTYNANGQPASSQYYGTSLQMAYDGDGLRGKRVENGNTTYYLRSSVLSGQVVCELNSGGGWTRGYVYLGGQLLAMQFSGVFWLHQEPYSKGQRLTDSNGNVTATIELDPWGGETNRSVNSYVHPRKFTTYDRDANYWDEAQARNYHGWWSRFAQPDPYDGSYLLANPQSFNRYAYTQNDPVNFSDPSGLCSFSVALNNQSNISADQLQAMMSRIGGIFAAAGQQINFLPANSRGADFNLTVFSSVAGSGHTEGSRTVGSTDLVSGQGSPATNNGRVYVDRLMNSATNTTMGRILFPLSPNFLGFGLGTAAAHEIGHRLLQQRFDSSAISGIMHAGFTGVEWFAAIRTFNAAQIMKLNSRCAPITTDATVPNTSPTMRPLIRGGGGGRDITPIFFGGGDGWAGFGGWTSFDLLHLMFRSGGGGYGEVVGYQLDLPQSRQ